MDSDKRKETCSLIDFDCCFLNWHLGCFDRWPIFSHLDSSRTLLPENQSPARFDAKTDAENFSSSMDNHASLGGEMSSYTTPQSPNPAGSTFSA
jgi:hypothetical protein